MLRGHGSWVYGVAFAPDGRRVASASDDRTVRVWAAEPGREPGIRRAHQNLVVCYAFSPNGRWLATGSFDTTVRVWDARTGREQAVLRGHQNVVQRVVFSADGEQIVSGSSDSTVRMWEAETGKCVQVIPGTGDVEATAVGAQWPQVRPPSRNQEWLDQFPVALGYRATHPSGLRWVGVDGDHVYLIQLEGPAPPPGDSEALPV